MADAAGGMVANAIVLNPDATASVRLAAYRIDAIRRHIEQHSQIPAERMREFFAETVAQADVLLKADAITGTQHDAAIAFVQSRRV